VEEGSPNEKVFECYFHRYISVSTRTKIIFACIQTYEKCIQTVVGKPEGKKPLAKPRRRWKDNIRMDLREVG